jgi:hypothetical protein
LQSKYPIFSSTQSAQAETMGRYTSGPFGVWNTDNSYGILLRKIPAQATKRSLRYFAFGKNNEILLLAKLG